MIEKVYRVVCPDGHKSREVHDDLDMALEAMEQADDVHDTSICDGPHRIQVAVWQDCDDEGNPK